MAILGYLTMIDHLASILLHLVDHDSEDGRKNISDSSSGCAGTCSNRLLRSKMDLRIIIQTGPTLVP